MKVPSSSTNQSPNIISYIVCGVHLHFTPDLYSLPGKKNLMASSKLEEEGAVQQQVIDDLLRCTFDLTKLMTLRCAIELGIPDIVENHPNGITLADLSAEVGCCSAKSSSLLHRIMRFLIHHGFFKQVMNKTDDNDDPDSPIITYAQTTLSHLITKHKMAPYILLKTGPEAMACKLSLSHSLVSKNGEMISSSAFEAAHGVDIWRYATCTPHFGDLFNTGLGFLARNSVSLLIQNCKDVFDGIGCLVDVGGGRGTALRAIVKACPGITRAVNFDLPEVVSSCNDHDDLHCLEHVGGDMFDSVPKADAAFIKSVLHDWGDEECVKILKNIKEAIPEETGKVIIVENVLMSEDDGDDDEYREFHLGLDIEMLLQTDKGKERSGKEWGEILKAAGFTKHTVTRIPAAPLSVIQAYP